MHELSKTSSGASRLRTALIAGGTALVMGAGAFVTGALDIGPGSAQAETEEATTAAGQAATPAAPFDFAELAQEVRSAVVSVQVAGEGPEMMMRGPDGGGLPEFFENLPEDHPMRRFFRDYGMPFGEENGQEAPDRDQPPGPPGGPEQRSQGSGFFISEDGYIVTNSHVVSRGDDIRVVLEDGREYNAEIVGIDSQTDLALLKVDPDGESFDHVSFTETESRVGEWVIAVGNPFGLGGTVTAGIISATGREIGAGPYDDFLQIDASVNRGNSGGPSFNLDGDVVGVNTAIFSPSGGNVGIAFAIPSSVAVPVIEQLRETGEVQRGWLGVQIQPVTEEIAESVGLEEARGAIVADLMDTGPAGDAGIEPGDIVLSVDEAPVDDARDLARRIGGMAPGETVSIQVWRDGEAVELELELGLRPGEEEEVTREPETEPEDEAAGRLGLSLAPADTAGVDRGVMIVEVDPEGEGARRGLQSGDVILEAGGEEVSSPEDVRSAVERAEEMGRSAILLRVLQARDESQRFVALSIAGS